MLLIRSPPSASIPHRSLLESFFFLIHILIYIFFLTSSDLFGHHTLQHPHRWFHPPKRLICFMHIKGGYLIPHFLFDICLSTFHLFTATATYF
ncbi:hypothetical protein BDW75DRAFT_157722 [Aspergillus navahoensis]